MCLALETVAMLAVSSMQAVAKHDAEVDAADHQEKVNANQRAAIQQQRDAERMDAERAQQEAYEAAASSTNAHAQQTYKDMAAFEAIIGESGGGVSGQRAAAAIGIKNGQDMATLASNARKQQAEIGFGDLASQGRANAGIAAIQSVRRPSLLEPALTIAGAGINAYTTEQKIRTAKGGA